MVLELGTVLVPLLIAQAGVLGAILHSQVTQFWCPSPEKVAKEPSKESQKRRGQVSERPKARAEGSAVRPAEQRVRRRDSNGSQATQSSRGSSSARGGVSKAKVDILKGGDQGSLSSSRASTSVGTSPASSTLPSTDTTPRASPRTSAKSSPIESHHHPSAAPLPPDRYAAQARREEALPRGERGRSTRPFAGDRREPLQSSERRLRHVSSIDEVVRHAEAIARTAGSAVMPMLDSAQASARNAVGVLVPKGIACGLGPRKPERGLDVRMSERARNSPPSPASDQHSPPKLSSRHEHGFRAMV